MSNKITIKRSAVTGKVPEPSDLDYGEFALNYTDGNLFFKSNANVITNLASTQFVSVTGNVTGNYFIGNGSQLTGVTAVAAPAGNTNEVQINGGGVTSASANFTFDGTNVSVLGNITGNYFIGNGSGLSAITGANVTGQVGNALVSGTVYTAAQPNITSVGTLTSVSVTGTATAGNLSTAGTVSATGNILGGNLSGTSIVGTLTTAAQTNITSVGTLSALSVTGNITGGNLVTAGAVTGNGRALTSLNATNIDTGTLAQARLANAAVTLGSTALTLGTTTTAVTGLSSVTSTTFVGALTGAATTAGTVTTAAQPNITSVGTLTSVSITGNTTSGNFTTAGLVNTGTLQTSGNAIVGGNLIVNGNTISVNVTNLNVQDPIIGLGRGANNAPLTSNDGKDRGTEMWYYNTAERAAFVGYDNSTGKLIAAANVSITDEIVTVNNYGTFVAGAVESTTVSAAGNVTGGNVIGNGRPLTSLSASNLDFGTVNAARLSGTYTITVSGAATTAGTVTTAAQPNITSVGTLTALSVTGNVTGGNISATGIINVGTGTGTSSGNDNLIKPASSSAFLNIKGGAGRAKLTLGNDVTTIVSGTSDDIIFGTDAGVNDSGTERVRIKRSTGNVGIGTTAPTGKLHVVGDIKVNSSVRYQSPDNSNVISSNMLDGGTLSFEGNSGQLFSITDSMAGSIFSVNDVSGIPSIEVLSSGLVKLAEYGGNVGIGTSTASYKLQVNGSFAATTKSFLINHPTKPGKKLRHGSLEGPEHGVYVRGKVNGTVIELPEYWTNLVDPDSITVQLTAISKGQKLYVEDVRDNKVYIANDGVFSDVPNCFYLIQAERVDIEKMDVEID
jgi:hypothetical protein